MDKFELTSLTTDLKLYHVVACTIDGDSLDWNVLATSHQDALDRLIEFGARGFFGQPHGPISRQAIVDEDWDCDGIQNREGPEVVVWEVRVSQADPVTGCIPWDSSNNGDRKFLPASDDQPGVHALLDHFPSTTLDERLALPGGDDQDVERLLDELETDLCGEEAA